VAETVEVLVLVKAAPQPSATYGDTVCVAGVLMGQQPSWIRLYPVPFRYMDGSQQFKKYDVVRVQIRDAGADKRPESRKINAESVEVRGHLGDWQSRSRWIEPLVGPSMCDLVRGAQLNLNATSLGAVRPRHVDDRLSFDLHGPWTQAQQAKIDAISGQPDLFGDASTAPLTPPRFKASLRWRCEDTSCPSHTQRIIDWELNALQRRYRDDEAIKSALTNNFLDRMFKANTDPLIYVGNQEAVARRAAFTLLGTYYPKIGAVQPELF